MLLINLVLIYTVIAKLIFNNLIKWPNRNTDLRLPADFTTPTILTISLLWPIFLPVFVIIYGVSAVIRYGV